MVFQREGYRGDLKLQEVLNMAYNVFSVHNQPEISFELKAYPEYEFVATPHTFKTAKHYKGVFVMRMFGE